MANVQYSKQSVAYNLELFDNTKREVTPRPAPKPPSRGLRVFKAILYTVIAIVCIIMVLSVLANYARLTELSMEASSLSRELDNLKEAEARITVDIDKKTTLKEIENVATKTFGMVKIQDYQREYIDMRRSDKAEIMKVSPFQEFLEKMKSAFSGIKEYISHDG